MLALCAHNVELSGTAHVEVVDLELSPMKILAGVQNGVAIQSNNVPKLCTYYI